MSEIDERYNEEFNTKNLTYILHVREIDIQTDEYHTDYERDEEYVSTTETEISNFSHYYTVTEVSEDKEGGGGKVYNYNNHKSLYNRLFQMIVEDQKDSKYPLYQAEGLDMDSTEFVLCPEYNGTHYIVKFERQK